VNTGSKLRTLSGNATTVAALTLSGDGRTLYLMDQGPTSSVVRALDSSSGALLGSYPLSATVINNGALAVIRPDAHALLLSPMTGEAFDLATGARSAVALGVPGPALAVTPDQTTLYAMDTGFSPAGIARYSIAYSTLAGVGFSLAQTAANTGFVDQPARANGADLAVSADGARLYVAAGAPYEFDVLDGASLVKLSALGGSNYPDNVETGWNGIVAAGASSTLDPVGDLWFYDGSGNLLGRGQSGGNQLFSRALVFSGDGARVVTGSGTGLRIQVAPAPP
jgi:hypothetical protein